MYAHVHIHVHVCTCMLHVYVYAFMQNVTMGYGRQQANTLHCTAIISSSQKRILLRMGFGSHTHQSGDREQEAKHHVELLPLEP